MSGVVHNTNRNATALSVLISQFRDLPNFKNYIGTLTAETQLLEDVFFQLLLNRAISSAQGVQLDGIGDRIGQPRLGWDDPTYQLWLYARALINRSNGAVEDIYSVFRLIAPVGSTFWYEYTGPCQFILHLTNGSPTLVQEEQYAEILQEMTAGGVNGYFHFQPQFEFTYDIGPGYDQGVYSGDGA